MKELSIEEKAKAYDKAIERMKSWVKGEHPECFSEAQKAAEFIFPELKDSEDERIRIALYLFVEAYGAHANYEVTKEEMLAWLEKQGETFTKKDVDDAYLKGVTDTKNEIEKQYEETYQIRKDIATFIFNYRGDIKDRAKWMDYLGIKVSFVEKQGEQKPDDKVEPKFKKE